MFISFQDNTTPLYIACQENNVEVVEVLLEAGAQEDRANDVSACLILLSPLPHGHFTLICTQEGMTPLMIASQNGHVCVVCALISAKANAVCYTGQSIHRPCDDSVLL